MAYLNTIGCGEGLSSSRPPLFDGTNFATWKTRFRIYARSQGVKVWMAIEDGIIIPTKIIDDVIYEKKVSEYTHEEEDRMNIAAKAEMVLTSALAEKEYKRVNNCKSAQEMWNKLVVTYEGTTDIKDSRMDTLIMEYENFKLQEGENIIDMETRFTRIVDELAQLGKNYTQNEKNRRVLKSLPPSWKVKVTTIKEMHNLNDYHIDNLFGNLRAYEEDNVPDIVVPKVEEKKKNMALKAILIDDDDNDEELNEELKNLDEGEIALLTRQLRRVLQSKAQRYGKGFLKSNNQQRVFNSNGRPNYSQNYAPNYKSNFPASGYNKGKGIQNSNSNSYNNANNNNINNNNNYTPPKPKEHVPEEAQDVCFECKQPGHYKRECPKLAKGRVLVAENGWDLSEDEEASEASEEMVNLCLMASDDASTSTEDSTTNQEVSGPSRILDNMHLFIDSSLNLLDMSKSDLIDLLVHINNKYCDADQRFLSIWSEHEKLKNSSKDQQKELTRIKESMIKSEDEINSLNDQNDFLKLENNKYKDNITNLEVENVSLLLQAEELENEKLQLNENNCKLHVDALNLKILNESLTQERSTPSHQKSSLEIEKEMILVLKENEKFQLETQRLKDENIKLLSQVKDQEISLNQKINSLIKEKENLEIVVQRFTHGNEILNKMVYSKNSFNREGLGYDINTQSKRVKPCVEPPKVAPKPPTLKCSYCNKIGHSVSFCKYKSGEIKGKHVWIPKESKSYTRVDKAIPKKNGANKNQRQPRFSYHQQPIAFQNRNERKNTNSRGNIPRSHNVPKQSFYHYPTPYHSYDRNYVHPRNDLRQNAYYARNHASRLLYVPQSDYPMPKFHYANSRTAYVGLTPGPSRQKGTNKFY
ncbi:uncharacterized protein LOC135149496 [Daucus carota subsp. sativus]|uniref:uncharacterized protein LOC135149496 n=1 Tax=Daucus carota subsp. sativus TaxID=79200 RepID=UPI003082DF23